MVTEEDIRAQYMEETGENCFNDVEAYAEWMESELVGVKTQLEFANSIIGRM